MGTYKTDHRPLSFSEVEGQGIPKKTLINSVKKPNTLYLFAGPSGTGKTTLARIFAKALNCSNFTDDVCNKCEYCKEMMMTGLENPPYISEHDMAVNGKVENARAIIETTFNKTVYPRKVYILDEFHQATDQAESAFLKHFEEPATNVVFVICTTEPQAIKETIKTRASLITLMAVEPKDIKNLIKRVAKKEKIDLSKDQITDIIGNAKGSPRHALGLLEEVDNAGDVVDASVPIGGLLKHIVNGDTHLIPNELSRLDSNQILPAIELTMNVLLNSMLDIDLRFPMRDRHYEFANRISEKFDAKKISNAIWDLDVALGRARDSSNPFPSVTVGLMRASKRLS